MLGLSHKGYIDRVLERFNMQSCSSGIAPILKGDKLSKMQCPRNNMEREQKGQRIICSHIKDLNN